MGRLVGTVQFFDAKKAYGFIVGADGQKYFFRAIDILKKYKACRCGEKVLFETVRDTRGIKAVKVRSIGGTK